MGKRIRIKCILIALVFAILAASGVAVAFAMGDTMAISAFRHGSGTQEDPYRISTATQLMSLQEISASPLAEERTKGKYFVLCDDFKITYRPSETKYGFCGTLDGGGHSISTDTGRFLFWRLMGGATVKNVHFATDLVLNAYTDVYGVFNRIEEGALFTDCTVKASIEVTFDGVPAQAAKRVSAQSLCYQNDGKIANSTFDVHIFGGKGSVRTRLYLNGITHTGIGSIENCTVNGNIEYAPVGTYSYISGISRYTLIENCSYYGTIHLSKTELKNVMTLQVYALGPVTEGKFVGDILSDCQHKATLYVSLPYKERPSSVRFEGRVSGFSVVDEAE